MKINNLIARFLVNKTTKEEYDTLDAWKQESQDNLTELLEMKSIWNDSVDLKGYQNFSKKSAWDAINQNLELSPAERKPRTRIVSLRWVGGIAAAISIVIFSVLSIMPSAPDGYNRITALDGVENITLPDGSEIYMNKNAALDYAVMFDQQRNVVLDGEAYFDVERDESSPFTIKTDHAEITVLGTSFNIEEREDRVDIYVTSGSVKVSTGLEEVVLTRNEMVTCRYGKITKVASPGSNYLSWKTNRLAFNDTPLHKVVADLKNHYNKRISFASDSKAMNQLVSDVFEKEDFESVLENLVLITGIRYHKDGANYVIE